MARVNQEKTPKRNYSEDNMTKKSAADGILPKTQTAVMNILNFRIFLLMNLTFWYYASQHTVKPLLREGWGNGLKERGVSSFFP